MFRKKELHPDLEKVCRSLMMNAANNYKDAAQADYRDFLALYRELDDAGKLTKKQKTHYEAVLRDLFETMKGYSHAEQKPDYSDYRGTRPNV